MELKTVDPRILVPNLANPRRSAANPQHDAQLLANIKAVGILQPPLVRRNGDELQIIAGHRRVAAAIAAEMPNILVLLRGEDDGGDAVRALSENVVRAPMGPVDQWRAIEALVSADWTEAAIADALALPVRTLRKLRLLAGVHPAMLDHMARGDMPDECQLRDIVAASPAEQATVWKRRKPKRDAMADWWQIASALQKRRISAQHARFGDDLAQAYGVVWTEDLFAPEDEDGRYTEQVEGFMGAQAEWLANNLPENGILLELDAYQRPKLPPRAEQVYGKPGDNDRLGFYLDSRSGAVQQVAYRLPAEQSRSSVRATAGQPGAGMTRPDITQKGVAMIGYLRTEALHAALLAEPIADETLLGLLVIALAGRNVTVQSGSQSAACGMRDRIAGTLIEGGVLSGDTVQLRQAARSMLVEVLSCRGGRSQSGVVARIAGMAINADRHLPNMATQEFLQCLSKNAMQQAASGEGVLPRNTGKEIRTALIGHIGDGYYIHPAARFMVSPEEAKKAGSFWCDPPEEVGALEDEGEAAMAA